MTKLHSDSVSLQAHGFDGWPGFPAKEVGFAPYHPHEHGIWEPCTDVCECDNAFTVRMDLAGIDPGNISIIFEKGVLIVRGSRPERELQRKIIVRQLEICYGIFQRRLVISENIDAEDITARYSLGFLEIVLPKLSSPSYSRIVIHVG